MEKNSLLKDLARTPFERRSLLNFGSFTWWSGFLSKQRFDLQLFLKNVWWQWSQRVINCSEEMLTRHFCPPIRQSVRNSGHAEGGWQQSPKQPSYAFRNSYDTPPTTTTSPLSFSQNHAGENQNFQLLTCHGLLNMYIYTHLTQISMKVIRFRKISSLNPEPMQISM